jgi:hypothetical protein
MLQLSHQDRAQVVDSGYKKMHKEVKVTERKRQIHAVLMTQKLSWKHMAGMSFYQQIPDIHPSPY